MEGVQPRPVGENLNLWRLSFRKILLRFKDLSLRMQAPLACCRSFTERIVTQYNEGRQYGRYKRVFQEGALPAWENKGGFEAVELDLYLGDYPHRFQYADDLVALGADPNDFTSSNRHYLFFLYGTVAKIKRAVLFAFTTGQAYNVFKDFIDFQFPNQVARALLISKNVKDTQDRWTVGPVLASHSWYKEGESYEDNPNALEKIYITFRAVINPLAEVIDKVSVIETGTTVKVTRGSICFHKRIIPIDEFPTLIAHLSCVVEGERTGLKKRAKPPEGNFSWLDYLVPLEEGEQILACRKEAQRLIWNAVQHPDQPRSFTFCPKYFFDYRLSSKVTCRIKKEGRGIELREWTSPPDTQEIIHCIEDIKEDEIPVVELTYYRNGALEHENLVSCFDGELFLQGKRVFRAYGLWYRPNADYMKQVQASLNRLIQDHLIPLNKSAVHPHLTWQKGAAIKDQDTQPYDVKVSDLAKQKGRYLDDEGNILCRKLFAPFFGRSMTFKQFHQSIQDLLNRLDRPLTVEDFKGLGIQAEKAQTLFKEMKTEKQVLDPKHRIVVPYYEGISPELAQALEGRVDHHEEGHYNAAFHERGGIPCGGYCSPQWD